MSHSNVGFCDHSNKEWPVRRRPRRRYNWPRDERPDSTLRRSAVKGRDVGDRSLYCISAPVMPLAFGEETSGTAECPKWRRLQKGAQVLGESAYLAYILDIFSPDEPT